LPANIVIGPAPPELVDSVTVTAGYTEPVSGVVLPIGSQKFTASGGKFNGTIAANAGGKFPTQVTVAITVVYTDESGLDSISETIDVAVTPAGATLNWDVPNRAPITTRILLDLQMYGEDSLDLAWQFSVAGTTRKTGGHTAAAVGGHPFDSTPKPNTLDVVLFAQPGVQNTFVLSIRSQKNFNARSLEPFDLSQGLRDSTIAVRCEHVDGAHARLVAKIS